MLGSVLARTHPVEASIGMSPPRVIVLDGTVLIADQRRHHRVTSRGAPQPAAGWTPLNGAMFLPEVQGSQHGLGGPPPAFQIDLGEAVACNESANVVA
jgi:hypothetical protein